MPLLSQPSSAARVALVYVTGGALIFLWSALYRAYVWQYVPDPDPVRLYFCYGVMLSGATLFIIGLLLGRIGRAARHAELPPPEVTATVAKTDQEAAATGVASPLNPIAPTTAAVPAVPPIPPVAGTIATQPVLPNGTVPVATLTTARPAVPVPNANGPR